MRTVAAIFVVIALLVGVPLLLVWPRRRGAAAASSLLPADMAGPALRQTRALVLVHRERGEQAAAAELVAMVDRAIAGAEREAVVVGHEVERERCASIVERRAGGAQGEAREELSAAAAEIRGRKG